MKICSKCNLSKKIDLFTKTKSGFASWCNSCRAALEASSRRDKGIRERKKSIILKGQKLCLQCNKLKDFRFFSPATRGLGGIAAYCKECFCARPKNQEKAKKATQKYRDVNRLRWRALHRINQRNRKRSIKAVSDGTVTDDFLESLYSTSICYYCYLETPFEKRTADHKISLSKGGPHSSSNLVMACFHCNSSKRDMCEEKFRRKLNADKS